EGTHGGRRPALARPKAMVNNLRHGLDSRTVLKAAMIIVTFPDVHRLFEAIINSTDRSRYRSVLTAARANLRGDPTLADSIKSDAALALLQTLDQIQEGLQLREIFSSQSTQSSRFYDTQAHAEPADA
ncbi:MAG TPA: hypothetical protein VFY10_09800, partial [Dehalococcoidia bacterium]|nr:hypothetical protein [Dehalococcoidia bacterium]